MPRQMSNAPESRQSLKTLGNSVRAYRQRHAMDRVELARKLGCSMFIVLNVEQARFYPSVTLYWKQVKEIEGVKAPLT